MQELSTTIERVHAVTKYSKYYKEYNASLPDKAFFKSTKLRLPYMKLPFQSLKNPIPSSQIQGIFYLSLIIYKKKEYPHARVFFLKIYYGRALQDTKKLRDLYG